MSPETVLRAQNSQRRNGYFDALRGVAIILVVLGHASTGIGAAGLTTDRQIGVFSILNSLLYLTHMPLLAFLMGINIPASQERKGRKAYLFNRIYFFLHLYLLWTLIQGVYNVLGSSFSNDPRSLADILNLLKPQGHLWFLPWAVIGILFVSFAAPWKNTWRAIGALLASGLLSWLTWGFEGQYFWQNGNALYVYLVGGALLGIWMMRNLPSHVPGRYLFLSFTLGTLSIILILVSGTRMTKPTSLDTLRTPDSVGWGIVASLAICLTLSTGLALLYRFDLTFKSLEYLGRYSLQIYLAHLLFTPTTRLVLVKLGMDGALPLLLVSTVVGILIPLLVRAFTSRYIPWVFSPPRNMRAALQARTSELKEAKHV